MGSTLVDRAISAGFLKLHFIAASHPCLWVHDEVVALNALILELNEDEAHSINVSASLKKSGHTVILAKNFSDAISILQKMHVDMIISDVHLQNGGNVFDFLRWVKRNPPTMGTPFVLFSSEPTAVAKFIDDGLKTSARLLGAAMYITMENFDEDEFRGLIDLLLKQEP